MMITFPKVKRENSAGTPHDERWIPQHRPCTLGDRDCTTKAMKIKQQSKNPSLVTLSFIDERGFLDKPRLELLTTAGLV